VTKNSIGYAGAPGDKHYKCFHGNRQVITIPKASRSNLGSECFRVRIVLGFMIIYTELIRHLKNNFPVMYRLYSALHTQT
jgi:hypothetical protein